MATLRHTRARPKDPASSPSLWTYAVRLIRHPRRTWPELLADPARLRYGFFAVLFVGLGYALTVAGIARSGGIPSTPWIAIPRDDYFAWEALFIAPVTLLAWILAAGVVHLLSRLFHGRGSFDDTLALLGFAVALPTLISLVPDAIRAALTTLGLQDRAAWEDAVSRPGTADWWFLWSYMSAYMVGLLILFPLATAAAQRLPRRPALIAGVLGAIVYQDFYLIFIR